MMLPEDTFEPSPELADDRLRAVNPMLRVAVSGDSRKETRDDARKTQIG